MQDLMRNKNICIKTLGWGQKLGSGQKLGLPKIGVTGNTTYFFFGLKRAIPVKRSSEIVRDLVNPFHKEKFR